MPGLRPVKWPTTNTLLPSCSKVTVPNVVAPTTALSSASARTAGGASGGGGMGVGATATGPVTSTVVGDAAGGSGTVEACPLLDPPQPKPRMSATPTPSHSE